jgi:hypothetical protein
MFRRRNLLLLLAVAVVAFAAFLWTGNRSGEEGGPADASPGGALIEENRSRLEKAQAELARDQERKRTIATLQSRSRGAPSGKPQKVVDPMLLQQLQSSARSLIPIGPPVSPRAGIVRQSFTVSSEITGGAAVTRGGNQGAGEEEGAAEVAGKNKGGKCGDCGAPSLKVIVVDVVAHPIGRAAYEKPCGSDSLVIAGGFVERFNIGDKPACVIYIPQTCRGSGVAIFEDRFVISVHGECIPDHEFLKIALRR